MSKLNGWTFLPISIIAFGISYMDIIVIALEIAVLSIALMYSIWKWRSEYLKNKK